MREIKFRAWDKEEKAFCKENYVLCWIGGPEGTTIDTQERFVIQQYTGLHDKNGKEIYEGDIVFAPLNETRYQVKWGRYECPKSEWEDDFHYGPFIEDMGGFQEGPDTGESLEVIGNIYENPELLESK